MASNAFYIFFKNVLGNKIMNELQELRKKIENQDYQGALTIISELAEMSVSVEDKINKFYILQLYRCSFSSPD